MKKLQRKSLKPNHKGGAVYTFDLKEKIGGLPSRIPLNGTADGDCPSFDVKDLGLVNYGAAKGGARKHKSHKSKRNSRKHKSRNNKKNTRKNNSRYRK